MNKVCAVYLDDTQYSFQYTSDHTTVWWYIIQYTLGELEDLQHKVSSLYVHMLEIIYQII